MSVLLIVLTMLFAAIGLGALLALAWLGRMLRWETVEDDALHDEIANGRKPRVSWFARHAWFREKPRLLTYRRDNLGRFRRYRR